jgi:zinc/manganese transport system substrate-binding protein
VPVLELPTEVSRSWGDIHPQGNPHVWLDPLNVIIIGGNIAERLKQLDPSHADYYQSQFTQFRNRIEAALFGEGLLKAVGKSAGEILTRKARNGTLLDWVKQKKLESKLGGWMKIASDIAGTKVISYHKTYVYFGDRFGLKMTDELEEKPGIPPPPQHRDAVIEEMKRDGIKVILNDNFYSREAADYVAGKTGGHVVVTYVDVGGIPETSTYEKLISYLLEEIQQANR